MNPDELEPKPRPGDFRTEDLSRYGVADLEARIAAHEAEIARCKSEIAKRKSTRAAADAVFK